MKINGFNFKSINECFAYNAFQIKIINIFEIKIEKLSPCFARNTQFEPKLWLLKEAA